MPDINARISAELEKRKAADAYRTLKINGNLVDFSSNDYLGFAKDGQLKKNILDRLFALRKLGSGGSRLLTGNNSLIEKLEKDIAAFHAADAALFFNSGYEANAGLLATILKKNDTIFYDALIHASLREGIRLSHAQSHVFAHNAVRELAEKLRMAEGEKFIVVESVYSMDGDISPLQEIVALSKKYGAQIILDEAHATGVIGERGEGLAQHLGLQNEIFARVHTFGKAMGFNGAAVLGSEDLRNYLINFCRPFIYSTAPNMMQVIAVSEAYRYLQQAKETIKKLQLLYGYFKMKVKRFGHVQILPSDSAICSVVIPGNANVKLVAVYMQNAGYDVRAIVSPTVAAGSERLRICIHSFNTELEIDRLCILLEQINTFIERDKEEME